MTAYVDIVLQSTPVNLVILFFWVSFSSPVLYRLDWFSLIQMWLSTSWQEALEALGA